MKGGRLSFYTDTIREVLARCLVLEVFTLLVLEVFLIRLLKCLRLSRDSVELQASRTTRDGSRAKCKAFFAKYRSLDFKLDSLRPGSIIIIHASIAIASLYSLKTRAYQGGGVHRGAGGRPPPNF